MSGSFTIIQLQAEARRCSLTESYMPTARKAAFAGAGMRGMPWASRLSSQRIAGRSGRPEMSTHTQVSRMQVTVTARICRQSGPACSLSLRLTSQRAPQ